MNKQTQPQAETNNFNQPGNLNTLSRLYIQVTTVIGILTSVVYIFGLYPILDITYYFLLMGMFLPIVFLLLPQGRKVKSSPGYGSAVLVILTLVTSIYLASEGRSMAFSSWIPPDNRQFIPAIIMYLVVLEGARRAGGMIFLVIVIFFSLFPLIAKFMPGILWAPPVSVSRTIGFNIYSNDALLGIVTRVVGETLIGYLILAALLVATGGANFFLKLALALMGHVRGGPAKVSILASALFGSLSGSIFSNIVSTGSVTIPAMKKSGFPGYYAGALEACASTGGMLMPPIMGALAFILADFTQTEYVVILAAATIPSLLFFWGLYWHIDSYAARNNLVGMAKEDVPSLFSTLREGWPFILVLTFLIWGLVIMRWDRITPFYASVLLIVLNFIEKKLRIGWREIPNLLFEIAKLLSQTMALLLPASFILGGLLATGVAPALTAEMVRLGGDNLILVLMIGVGVCIIFGMMGMIVAAYLMLALTLAPALEQIAGLNPLSVHLFIAYYASLGAITPPVALAAFLASRISDSDPILTSWHACRLGLVMYFIPFFFLFEPALIFQGRIIDTTIWFGLNAIAVMLIANASEGWIFYFGNINVISRVSLFVSGLLIGFPELFSTILGTCMLGIVLLSLRIQKNFA